MPHALATALAETFEKFDVGEIVELFSIDLAPIGGGQFGFAPSPVIDVHGAEATPRLDGQPFTPLPLESEGWQWTGAGPLPTPRLTFRLARPDGDQALAASALVSLIEANDDMLGARVTRIRTLRRHLDDGSDPDPQAVLGAEIFTVERKTSQTGDALTLELRSAIDAEAVSLPRRQALDRCPLRYRVPAVGGGFDYSAATCPYGGAARFGLTGQPVGSDAADRCGKRLVDCRLRFGQHAVLPFGGFPGVGRIRA